MPLRYVSRDAGGRSSSDCLRPCLEQLKEAGYIVGVASNQTARAGRLLHELNLPTDWILTSDDLGAEKPDLAFFEELIEQESLTPEETAYVACA